MKSYKFKIIGHVQGVFYRANIQKNASRAGFCGYIKNLQDRSVEACVRCDESRVDEFKEILKKGSSKSKVDEIQMDECKALLGNEFIIKR